MLEALILDKSAESRNRIRNRLCDFIYKGAQGIDVVPRINVKPISLDELKFQVSPRIIIVGNDILSEDKQIIVEIKNLFPQVSIIAWLTEDLNKLFFVEELARLGVTDIFQETITAGEFFRKLIILTRKTQKVQNSKIILVDSGKGGSGVTSISSSLGEIWIDEGKKVLLIDCDVESQDLSRFLQVRPFVNENLGLILDGLKPVSLDGLKECYQKVWDDVENFYLMSPSIESENLYSNKSSYYKNFLSVLEVLDTCFDYIIIDMACFKGILKTSLYKICDVLLVVINNDPASIFANLEFIKTSKNFLSANSKLYVIDNKHEASLLPFDILRDEVLTSANLMEDAFFEEYIAKSLDGSRWPGSGATLYSQSGKNIKETLEKLVNKIDEKEYVAKDKENVIQNLISYLKIFASKVFDFVNKLFERKPKKEETKLIARSSVITLPKDVSQLEENKEQNQEAFISSNESEENVKKRLFTKAV